MNGYNIKGTDPSSFESTLRKENCLSPSTSSRRNPEDRIDSSLLVPTAALGLVEKVHRMDSLHTFLRNPSIHPFGIACIAPKTPISNLSKLLDHGQDGRLQIQLAGIRGVDVDTDTVQGSLDGFFGTTVQHFIAD